MRARVKFPNSPESDRRPVVMHVVTLDDGREFDIVATDPLDAIETVRKEIRDGSIKLNPA